LDVRNPHGDGAAAHAEVGASALIQHDGLLLIPQRVTEGASGEAGAHTHVFAAAGAVRQDDGAAGAGTVFFPQARPSDDIIIIEIVDLLPIRRIPAKAEERVQLCAHRTDMVMGNAVIIPVKDTGKAIPAQEDQRVSERLEPALYPGGERLSGLSVCQS